MIDLDSPYIEISKKLYAIMEYIGMVEKRIEEIEKRLEKVENTKIDGMDLAFSKYSGR